MNDLENNIEPYSKAIVSLLKGGIVEHKKDKDVWEHIEIYRNEISEYLSVIGLELMIRKDDGFAFVKQFEDSEGKTLGLIRRRKIGYETSIVLIVLRQSLEDFESDPTQHTNEKFITDSEIKEELQLFLKEGYNRIKFDKNLNQYINNAVELGYLIKIREQNGETQYRIHKIIKEKITIDILNDFKTKLNEYVESI